MKTLIPTLLILILAGCGNKTSQDVNWVPLQGTTWLYNDDKNEVEDYTVTFAARGKLKTRHPNDITPDNDAWKQEGAKVVWSYNDSYAVYKGTFENKDLISGKAVNKTGKSWNWTLKRVDVK